MQISIDSEIGKDQAGRINSQHLSKKNRAQHTPHIAQNEQIGAVDKSRRIPFLIKSNQKYRSSRQPESR
jgi:hypothetical protein